MNKNSMLKWLPVIGLMLLMVGAWFTVRYQAEAAMSREEAYKTFVTIEAQDKFEKRIGNELNRMNDKLDRLIERR